MNEPIPANQAPKRSKKLRLSKRLKQAIDLLCSGKASTQRQAANLAKLSEQHLSRMLRRSEIRVLLTQRGQEIIAHAAPRAAARLVELMDGAESEHVSLKSALRIAESEGVIRPAGGAPMVNISNYGRAGFIIDWNTDRAGPSRPLTAEERAELERPGCPGIVRGAEPIDVTPEPEEST